MNAVTTKPRKGAPKLPAASAPAVYTRPEPTYRPAIGKTADERLATLRATLQAADEKLEAACDAVERGTAVDTLLDLINHDLLCRAAHPCMMGVEGEPYPTKNHLAQTYRELFPVLAALEGAMALSLGTVIYSTLAEVYNLLDWAQEECDSCALGKLLPAEAEIVATAPKPMPDWLNLSLTRGSVEDAKMLVDMVLDACQWVFADPAESELAQGRVILLSRAVEGYLTTACDELDAFVTQLQEQRR